MEPKYGHRKLIVWGNIECLESLTYEQILPKIPRAKYWLKNQIERSLDSIGSNFVEGYYSSSIRQYINYLGYCRSSLAELKDHVLRASKHIPIKDPLFSEFNALCNKTLYLLSRLVLALKKKT